MSLNLLAFDTSTEVLRIAVQGAGGVLLSHEGEGGARASSTLIPAIMALLAQAALPMESLDAIVFGRGPGSFTGLRTACSVAQGLAWGAGVPVLGIDTLLAVAEDARERSSLTQFVAVLDARMGEVYWAPWRFDGARWHPGGPPRLSAPDQVPAAAGSVLAGSGLHAFDGRLPALRHVEAVPSAHALLRLAPALIADGQATAASGAMPLYIRDKVAQTTEERAAARAQPNP